jgi:hypothetical protein
MIFIDSTANVIQPGNLDTGSIMKHTEHLFQVFGRFNLNYWHFITIFIGLILLFWGFWASFEAKKPWQVFGSITAVVGLVTALIGTLLLCVPDFFQ